MLFYTGSLLCASYNLSGKTNKLEEVTETNK